MIDERSHGLEMALLAAAILGAPLLLAAAILTDSELPIGIFAVVQAIVLLIVAAFRYIHWRTGAVGAEEVAYIAFFVVMTAASLMALGRFPELSLKDVFSPLALLFLWTCPVLILPSLISSRTTLALAMRLLDAVGLLVATTVLLAGLGVGLGEVQVSESTGLRRVFGLYGDSASIICAFFLVKAFAERRNARSGIFAAAVLLTVGVGAVLVAVTGIASVVLARRRIAAGSSRPRASGLGSKVLGAVVVVASLAALGGSFLARLTQDGALAFSFALRVGSFLTAFRVLADQFLTGIGFSAFRIVSGRYAPEELFASFSDNYTATAQNQLLQSTLDGGVLGLIAFVAMAFYCARRVYRAAAAQGEHYLWLLGSFGAMCGIAIGYQSGIWLVPSSLVPFLFFSTVGIVVGAERLRVAGTQIVRDAGRGMLALPGA